ncbi:MAG: hypothetical protein WB709_07790 [Solirubrobacteraceae bacterium]
MRKPSIYLSFLTTVALILGPTVTQAPAQAIATGAGTGTAQRERGDDPLAWAAREVNLQETGHLRAVGEPGTTIIERGNATGTFNCSIAGRLTILSANKVIATFTVRPKGGSITGRGSARFEQQGAYGYFGGTISITGGTGSYAHASGTNIGISGAISRETFALTVHVHGKIHV